MGRKVTLLGSFILVFCIGAVCLPVLMFGQNLSSAGKAQKETYIEIVNSHLQKASSYHQGLQLEEALAQAQEALKISQNNNYLTGKAQSLSLLGKISEDTGEISESLRFHLWAIQTLELINDQQKIAQEYKEIGYLYLNMKAYKKAKEYLLLYQTTTEKTGIRIDEQISFWRDIAFIHLQLKEYTEAGKYYVMLLADQINQKDTVAQERTLRTLAFISKSANRLEEAIRYHQRLLEIYRSQDNIIKLTNTYNDLGFLYKKKNDLKTSIEYFNNGISISQEHTEVLDDDSQVALFSNIGIAYTNLSLFARAKEYYLHALRIREKQENPEGEAYIYNQLASNYFVSGKNALALKSVMSAIDIGVTYDAKEVLATSYKILSLIYESDNNLGKAQLYEKKYREIMEHIEEKDALTFEEMLHRQNELERKEDDIKVQLREQEQSTLEAERRENELILKEKELAILKRDQELQAIALQNQQLEKVKAEQALVLARQQLQAEKKETELRELEKQKQLQDLKLKQQMLEKEQQEKAIALLEADQKLKEQKLQEEASIRNYGYGIIALFIFILLVVLLSFIQKRNDNKKLQHQQVEIKKKNEQLLLSEQELRKNMDELKDAQITLAEQKEQLELEYRKTQESIEYAKRIQFSILPTDTQRVSLIPDSFILYKPKDIVSGDFYWISKNEEKIIVSVVDCTGHGVPGALVSLIGNNVLNEAINEQQLLNPVEILHYLDKKVHQKLRQDEGQIKDGMDLGICTLEPIGSTLVKLVYSGAKNTMFIVTKGKLFTLKGDRKSIGGDKNNVQFSSQEMVLDRGDVIYLTTDGFIDQANPLRERFGTKKLKMLIEKVHPFTMADQKVIFENALAEHQQATEQRDDINFIGIRI